MPFHPGRFNALSRRNGQRVLWYRAQPCPCYDPATKASRMDCPVCQGRGTYWQEPVQAWTALAGQRQQREYMQMGSWQSGNVVLSIPSDSPLYECGDRDRVEMQDGTIPFTLSLVMRATLVMPFLPVAIERAAWFDEDGETLVEGRVPEVTAERLLVWQDGYTPPEGRPVSLIGRRRPEYQIVNETPQERAHGNGLLLPRRVMARVFDLGGR